MRTKQPIRSKRDHFMYLDCLESDHIEPVKMLVKPKALTEVASSPTSIFAPMSAAPPTMKLPEAVAKPRLPRASVWPHGEKVPWLVSLVPWAYANLATCYPGRLLTRPHAMRSSGCGPLYAPRMGCCCRCAKAAHSALLMQVWGSASPTLKRVWTSSREREVMDEWLDEVVLQNHAKMVLKSASAWPEKDREHKTKHAREPQRCPPKPAHAQCDRHPSPPTSHHPR